MSSYASRPLSRNAESKVSVAITVLVVALDALVFILPLTAFVGAAGRRIRDSKK